jgi:lysophospholipase L1-like esterase
MSLQARLADLIAAIGADIKDLSSDPALARVQAILAQPRCSVVFLGSSTTSGVGATSQHTRYVNRLSRMLQAAYPSSGFDDEPPVLTLTDAAASVPYRPGVSGINGGSGGTYSNSYVNSTIATQVGSLGSPIVCVHMIGANDYVLDVAPATYETNLQAAYDLLAAAAPNAQHVYINTYARPDEAAPAHAWALYGEAMQRVAVANDAMFIDLNPLYVRAGVGFGLSDPYDLIDADNIHQNDSGHLFMAKAIAQALEVVFDEPRPATVLRDRAERANGALTATETGQAYTVLSGTWAVSNKAIVNTAGGTVLVDSGLSDLDVTCIITMAGNATPGVLFRSIDESNRWGLFLNWTSQQVQLFRTDGGSTVGVAVANLTITNGRAYRMRVVASGDVIGCWVDDKPMISYTMSSGDYTKYGAITKVGIRASTAPAGLSWDNLAVRPLPGAEGELLSTGSAGGGSGDMLLGTAQTVTGAKTFPPGALLMQNAGATQTAEPYSDVNPPQTLMMTEYSPAVTTPPSGQIVLYSPDGTALLWKDDTGAVRTLGGGSKVSALPAVSTPVGTSQFPVNESGTTKRMTLSQIDAYVGPFRRTLTTPQTISAADTYITDSRLVLPQSRMQAGVVYRARIVVTKTAAGTGSAVINIRVGTAGTTGDTARLTYSLPAQTGAADVGFIEVQCTFRVVGASAVVNCWTRFDHNLASTGWANATRGFQGEATSATFDSTAANMGIGVSFNSGSGVTGTVTQCYAELVNLAN